VKRRACDLLTILLLAMRRCASGCFYIALIVAPTLAQTTTPAENALPDTPSASQQFDKASTSQAPHKSSLEIIYRKSLVFPDLATSRQVLTPTEKFELFISNSVSPLAVGGSLLGAGISQARNTHKGYGQGAEGYGKRFGSSMARSASSQFFGTFLLPTVMHQDPRYFPLKDASFKESAKHAARSLFIARTDSGGEAPNIPRLAGFLFAESLANVYLPEDERTVGHTFKRTGIDIAIRAGTNMLREYWPTLFKRLRPPANQN